jgi:peptide/nickel transport system permease protein
MSWAHPFGTDDLGQDILARILWGRADLPGRRHHLGAGLDPVGVADRATAGLRRWLRRLGADAVTDMFLSLPAVPLPAAVSFLFRRRCTPVRRPVRQRQHRLFVLIVTVISALAWMSTAPAGPGKLP